MSRINDFMEVSNHRKAYFQTARKFKVMKFRFYFHDLEKMILILLLGDKFATKIHRLISTHHDKSGKIKDVLGAIIDWECARITKPNKLLNARQTLNKYYSNLKNYNQFIEILNKLGL